MILVTVPTHHAGIHSLTQANNETTETLTITTGALVHARLRTDTYVQELLMELAHSLEKTELSEVFTLGLYAYRSL